MPSNQDTTYSYQIVSRESGQVFMGMDSALPKQDLCWTKVTDVPMEDEGVKDGLYLVRNTNTGMIDLVKREKYWYSSMLFNEYCFISPLPEKWRLPR
jgi:hypothetical protein